LFGQEGRDSIIHMPQPRESQIAVGPREHQKPPRATLLLTLPLFLALGCAEEPSKPSSAYAAASLSRGAHLYDDWQTVTGITPPGDNPGYKQTLGTVKGAATWRCKECHGVDYRGVDGFYGSGSHFSGVKGLVEAREKDERELYDAIRGECFGPASANSGAWLSDADVWALVKFVREGVIDLSPNLSGPTLDPVGVPTHGGDVVAGQVLYNAECSRCHGPDGATINIGTALGVSYIGTEAVKNGFNFQHRVRFGLAAAPGSFKQTMPGAVNFGWSTKDVIDVLTYARTLPQK
jgi:mono/diheme cytochrome c family protein